MDFAKLGEVASLRPIKGIPYPADVGFRRLIVTGPPGCGKSSRIATLGGWPGEAFLDLTRAGWWRDRLLATRPREVHLGLPFVGHRSGLALFEELQEGTPDLIFEPQRVRLPPPPGKFLPGNWSSRFVLEFLLPPAEAVLRVRQERAAEGTHPVDRTLYLEQIRHQLETYFRVAEILHDAGMRVIVRGDFATPPLAFLAAPQGRSRFGERRRQRGWRAGVLVNRLFRKRPERVIQQLDRVTLVAESLQFDDRLLPLEIKQGAARLRLYRDRPLLPTEQGFDSLILSYRDTAEGEPAEEGIEGFARLTPGERVRITHGDKVVKDSLPLPETVSLRLQIENAEDGIVITDLHSERGTEVAALDDSSSKDPSAFTDDPNIGRLLGLLDGTVALRSVEAAQRTLEAVNEQLEKGAWRPLDADEEPGSLVELPYEFCPVIVGDLHAHVDNLLKILCVNRFLAEVEAGRAVLIFLGDAVHSEESGHLAQMENSLVTMDIILRLMEAYPDRVIFLRGNHDSFSSEVTKQGVPQGQLWRRYVEQERGDAFLREFERFYAACPLIVASDDFVACHAGPPQGNVSHKRVVNAHKRRRMEHQLTWSRLKGPGHPGGYAKQDVKALKAALGISPKAVMIVGHNPLRDGQSVWLNAAGIKRLHVVNSAGSEEVGVFTRLGDRLRPLIYRVEPMREGLVKAFSPQQED